MSFEDLSLLAGLVSDILSGLEARGPRVEIQGPSLYEFMDDFLQASPGPDLHRIDDHAIALGEAVMVFEVIETTDDAVETSLDELERRGVHHIVSRRSTRGILSFHGTGLDGATFEGRIMPAPGWVLLIVSSNEEGASSLARMLDTGLGSLDRAAG